jgi:hypothetical protein
VTAIMTRIATTAIPKATPTWHGSNGAVRHDDVGIVNSDSTSEAIRAPSASACFSRTYYVDRLSGSATSRRFAPAHDR